MTHRKIKRFQIEGKIADDADIPRLKNEYVNMLYYNMRTKGYVPVLDIDYAFSTSYNGSSYDFVLSAHGVFYGPVKARKIYGLAGSKEIPME